MNKERRNEIAKVIKSLDALSTMDFNEKVFEKAFAAADSDLQMILSDEQDAFDNLPEWLQASREDSHDVVCGYLNEAIDALSVVDFGGERSEAFDAIQSAIEELQNI
jgi:hypothetical protein